MERVQQKKKKKEKKEGKKEEKEKEKEEKKEKKEKNRHLLIGRPSGGQSPCAWIPFSERDRGGGERVWASRINMKKEHGGFDESDEGLIGKNRM